MTGRVRLVPVEPELTLLDLDPLTLADLAAAAEHHRTCCCEGACRCARCANRRSRPRADPWITLTPRPEFL